MAGIRTHVGSFWEIPGFKLILTERHSHLSELESFASENISTPAMMARIYNPKKAKTGELP